MSALVSLFYLYDPWLNHIWRMAFVVGIVACVAVGYKVYRGQYPQGLAMPKDSLWAIGLLIGLSVIPLVIHQSQDFSVLKMYSKTLILFIFAWAIYQWLYVQQKEKIIRDLKIGIAIQCVLAMLALLGVEFIIEFLFSVHIPLPRFYGSEQQYRLYALTSSAFFQLSIFYCLLLHFLLAYHKAYSSRSVWWLLPLLIIGTLSGRTFLLCAWGSLLLYFQWRYLPSLVVFVLLILGLAYYFPEQRYIAHALEPIINLLHQGQEVSSSTTTLVEKHLFVPEFRHFVMGDGYYLNQDGRYYAGSDSGFIRQLFYGGVAYVLLCLVFTSYFIWRVAQNWFTGLSKWLFFLSTLGLISLFNIKADSYAFPGLMLVLLMFLSLFGTAGQQGYLFKFRK
ncbi:hypothetical protein EV694_2136 [Volucribacter psittacicida]|uniref:O-antigen ligase-like membrane protein n=1 Tax=Volucribacter psittacicida TaxID=203482 RepID=A0A4R1FIM4_9PAST|nr:hypothetical protein [Volucribacter psittacicida]TCJ94706.1 hypothetical protein EV694_2136 [Volucribacter psittacicida]